MWLFTFGSLYLGEPEYITGPLGVDPEDVDLQIGGGLELQQGFRPEVDLLSLPNRARLFLGVWCVIVRMVRFCLSQKAGVPIYEQAVYAATRAIVSGQLRVGDAFPSVRTLSRELKMNPNTAHKVISQLLSDGLLESRPGLGTVVAKLPSSRSSQRTELLNGQIEELVVEAKRLSIDLGQITAAIERHWRSLSDSE